MIWRWQHNLRIVEGKLWRSMIKKKVAQRTCLDTEMINYFNALVCYEITVFVCLLLLQSVFLSFIPRIVTITRSRYFWKSEYIDAKHKKTILTILDKQTKWEESRYFFIRIYYLCLNFFIGIYYLCLIFF